MLISTAIFKLEAWIKRLALSRVIFIGILKSQYKRDLHCSSSKWQVETLRRSDVQHFTITFHDVGTVQSDQSALACLVAGVERGRGHGGRDWREGDWGERVREACYTNPLLFIVADAGVRKFLFGWAVMNNLLACILACISERQTWWRHQANVFYWHKLWKIKITAITQQLKVNTRTGTNCNSFEK